jgi:hypothetical protein
MCDKESKALTLEFRTFGKRNTQRFFILNDLTLACDMCKTPEARRSITEMTRRYFAELQIEEQSLNKRIQKVLQDAAKKGKKKDKKANDTLDKALETAVRLAVKKEIEIRLGNSSKLKLKYRGLKKSPYVTFVLKF